MKKATTCKLEFIKSQAKKKASRQRVIHIRAFVELKIFGNCSLVLRVVKYIVPKLKSKQADLIIM